MKINPKVTLKKVTAAVRRAQRSLDNPGFCIACGEEAEGVEPDARGNECEHCGANKVYGAEELLIELA